VFNWFKGKSGDPKPLDPERPIICRKAQGVFFGQDSNGYYICKPEKEDGHILVIGGVGSGKSSCVAIPSLLTWSNPIFAIDIKGELHTKTKDKRLNAKVFNPCDKQKSYGYDPFFSLRTSENLAQDAMAIALAIIPLPPDTREPFWIESSQNILTASILHCYSRGETFLDTIEMIQSTEPSILIKELLTNTASQASFFVNSMMGMEDKTLASIMTTLSKNIIHFITDKDLKFALSQPTRNISPLDLERGQDVYIHIPEHLLRQWKNLLSLIVSQFLNHFEQRPEEQIHPILFLLDEFPRLGKINPVLDGLATLRSKKITICLIIQNLAQLDVIYGENERKLIVGMCAYKAILSADDPDTQEYFSKLAGTYDRVVTTNSENKAWWGAKSGTSESKHIQETRLIKNEEFGFGIMRGRKNLVLFAPFPLYSEKQSSNKDQSLEIVTFMHVDKMYYEHVEKVLYGS